MLLRSADTVPPKDSGLRKAPPREPAPPTELTVARTVSTGVLPKSVTLAPDGSRAYVCNFGLKGRRNVSVFDTESLRLLGYVHFAGNATEAVVSADGRTLYVSNFGRSRIEVIDTESLRVTHEIRVGANPKFMVLDEPRDRLYVSNWSSGTVSAVDTRRRKTLRHLPTGRRPRGLAVLDDGTLLVGAMWDHKIQVYRPGDRRPRREFASCENPRHLMLSPDQQRLYVSCSGERLLAWYDPSTGQRLGQAPTGRNPRTIDVSDDGRTVAVADFTSSTVTLVEPDTAWQQTFPVPRTDQIVGLAIAPGDALRLFVTSWRTNRLLELRPGGDAGVPDDALVPVEST